MKNNRRYNCRWQLWVSLNGFLWFSLCSEKLNWFSVFRETIAFAVKWKEGIKKDWIRKDWKKIEALLTRTRGRANYGTSGSIFTFSILYFVYSIFVFLIEKYILLFLREGCRSCENENWHVIDLLEPNTKRKERRQQLFFPSIPMLANYTKMSDLVTFPAQ